MIRLHPERPVKVLVITPFEDSSWRWLAHHFPDERYRWTFRNLDVMQSRSPLMFLHALRTGPMLGRHDLIVSFDAHVTLGVAAAMRLFRIKKTHLAFSFNHDNKRFFIRPLAWLARRILPAGDLYVVYCEHERELYHGMYGIPLERLSFQHWAVDPPAVTQPLRNPFAEYAPYVCAIGRSNRDFDTFIQALDGLPCTGIIATPQKINASACPPNIVVLSDLGPEDCVRMIQGAAANVVPILDDLVGAGHITIVHAMLLGKAQVVTEVETVRDYFQHEVHGLYAAPRSVHSMRTAILRLLQDPKSCQRYGENARRFALQWLVEEAAARNLRQLLDNWMRGEPYAVEPPGWSDWKRRNVQSL